jgi:hypothetical protein
VPLTFGGLHSPRAFANHEWRHDQWSAPKQASKYAWKVNVERSTTSYTCRTSSAGVSTCLQRRYRKVNVTLPMTLLLLTGPRPNVQCPLLQAGRFLLHALSIIRVAYNSPRGDLRTNMLTHVTRAVGSTGATAWPEPIVLSDRWSIMYKQMLCLTSGVV